jgi:hypothetical protein
MTSPFPVESLLTEDQLAAIKCAHADLQGSLQAWESSDPFMHDWKAHQLSIDELEAAFPFLISTL